MKAQEVPIEVDHKIFAKTIGLGACGWRLKS